MTSDPPVAQADRARPPRGAPSWQATIRLLVAATITYNVIEAVLALSRRHVASSTALIGFGLDSIIEVASAAAVAWQFSAPTPRSAKPANTAPCGSSPSPSSPWPPT